MNHSDVNRKKGGRKKASRIAVESKLVKETANIGAGIYVVCGLRRKETACVYVHVPVCVFIKSGQHHYCFQDNRSRGDVHYSAAEFIWVKVCSG